MSLFIGSLSFTLVIILQLAYILCSVERLVKMEFEAVELHKFCAMLLIVAAICFK